MVQSKHDCFQMPTKAAVALAKTPIGKFKPVLVLDDIAEPFTLLDCFDQSLRRSGRLLLKTGKSFALITSEGRIISQSAKRKVQFVADFREGPLKFALADVSPLRSLLRIGSGALRQGVLLLVDDDQKTRCQADLYLFTGSGGKGTAVIKTQGPSDCDNAHADLRRHIEACGGTPLGSRGLYAKISPQRRCVNAKPEPVIKAGDTAFAAATDIVFRYIRVARANENGIIANHDTEFLHDYRVALRKIRSVLSLFKDVYEEKQTDNIKVQLSDMMAPTGRLRDLDVYLLEKQRYYDLLPKPLHVGLNKMFTLFTKERKAEKAKLARHLRSRTYVKEISKIFRLFSRRKKLRPGPKAHVGAHGYACALIWDRYRKIRKIAIGIGPETDDTEMHKLRIHCKKLRYLMEFFGPLFPSPEVKALLMPLKQLQDHLGRFNDYSVQQVSLQDFLRKEDNFPDGVNLDVAQSVGALTAMLHHAQLEERAKAVETFAHFNSPSTQKAFHDLFYTGGFDEVMILA